jgi:hypothetical protein
LNAAQWIAQLGLLTVIPLFVLYWIEHGILTAIYKIIYGIMCLSPIFFMFGIQARTC